jgi:hypothetical protein
VDVCAVAGHRESREYDGIRRAESVIFPTLGAILLLAAKAQLGMRPNGFRYGQ